MEQLIELLPTIVGALLILGGGLFGLVRWLFSQEEKRRATANEIIQDLQQEVRLLRQDNKILFQEICELREQNRKLRDEIHALTRLLKNGSI
jgi:FtsZ-binding cell division protein ZapB